MSNPAILLVEDNEDDVFLFRRALKAAAIINPVFSAEDGQVALDYLSGVGRFADRSKSPIPTAIFLDLKLPLKSGFAVLGWIREQPNLCAIPVVILSSSDEPSDKEKAFTLGASAYQVKPPTPTKLLDLAKKLKWDWLRFAS
jgi:CheY-like chemotaxis protein